VRAERFITDVLGLPIHRDVKKADYNAALTRYRDGSVAVSLPVREDLDDPDVQHALWHEAGHYIDDARIYGGRSSYLARVTTGKYSSPAAKVLSKHADFISSLRIPIATSIYLKYGKKVYRSLAEVDADPSLPESARLQFRIAVRRGESRRDDYERQDIELFAEGFADYMMNRERMRKEAPELAALYDKVVADQVYLNDVEADILPPKPMTKARTRKPTKGKSASSPALSGMR
jgi:hypothetical protein